MKKKYLSQRIRHSLWHMRLSDRCLCLFLLFLLLQSAWHIFFAAWPYKRIWCHGCHDPQFCRHHIWLFHQQCFRKYAGKKWNWNSSGKPWKNPCGILRSGSSSAIRYKLSYSAANPDCCRCIGFFSLIILTFVRICTSPSQDAIASLSQFQDFLVGSIGFWVGHAK